MRKSLALFGALSTVVVFLSVSAGSAAADSQPGGCPAFGAFMGSVVPYYTQFQHPLGQHVRGLTPFGDALAGQKAYYCGQ